MALDNKNKVNVQIDVDSATAIANIAAFRVASREGFNGVQQGASATLAAVRAATAGEINAFNALRDAAVIFKPSEIGKELLDLGDKSSTGAKGVDKLTNSLHGGRSSAGQFIEALAQGDPGELLGEIAQSGGKAGIAIAGLTLIAAGAALAIGKMTASMIETVLATDKLAKDTKLTANQIQALQVVANLTGESVDDLAKNYKKIAPEVERFEELVKSSGAAIDEDLREKTQRASLAWEELKIQGQGALNAIARESLPEVTAMLREFNQVLINIDWSGFGSAAAEAISTIRNLMRMARQDLLDFALTAASGPGGMLSLFDQARDAARTERENGVRFTDGGLDFSEYKGGGFPKIPSLAKSKGGGGQKDITATKEALDLLEVEEKAIKRIAEAKIKTAKIDLESMQQNGTMAERAEAYERYAAVVIQAETEMRDARLATLQKEAEVARTSGDLKRRAKNVKLAQIEEDRLKTLSDYNQKIDEIDQEALKNKNKSEQEYIDLLLKRTDAENKYLDNLIKSKAEEAKALADHNARIKTLINERRALDVQDLKNSADKLERAGNDPTGRISQANLEQAILERRSRAIAIQEDVRHSQFLISLEKERADNKLREQTYAQYIENVRQLDLLEEAEKRRHTNALAEEARRLQADTERLNPISTRSLFGDRFADLLENGRGKMQALAQTASEMFQKMSSDAGNFGTIAGDAVSTFTQGLGEMFATLVLGGETGPAALRKLTAAVLAQVAQQAAVKAVYELAAGFASLFYNPAESAGHFTAAALYGSVAAIAGFAAQRIAPAPAQSTNTGSGGGNGNNGPRIINQDSQRPAAQIILRVEPGIVAEHVAADYKNNGTLRQYVLNDRE